MIDLLPSDFDEIVAIQIKNDIYFGETAINKTIALQDFTRLFSRAVFKFMAIMDLGPQWDEFANSPTLFTITEYKNFESNNK